MTSTAREGWINPKASSPSYHPSPSTTSSSATTSSRAKALWRKAFTLVLLSCRLEIQQSSFSDFDYSVDTLAATRYSYDVDGDVFVSSNELVKIEREPFAKGAIRRCFRVKKLSKWVLTRHFDFEHASCYVAKDYPRAAGNAEQLTKTDVKLQMTAKSLAARWNLTRAPRKVDFMMCFALHVPSTNQWYCCERFLKGEYVKFNSNQGYVDRTPAGWCRSTPQAFSHFTFEVTAGAAMCTDVQGVEDLFTDPEIQSLVGTDFGEGNLGPKGMAMFFKTHRCNAVCAALGLHPVALHPSELTADAAAGLEGTLVRIAQPSPAKRGLRGSQRGSISGTSEVSLPAAFAVLRRRAQGLPTSEEADAAVAMVDALAAKLLPKAEPAPRESLDEAVAHKAASSRGNLREALSLVHLELAKLSALQEPAPNPHAALFHYVQAALHGHTASALGLANLYADHPSALLAVSAPLDLQRARFFCEIAAGNGSRCAAIKMAALVDDPASKVDWLERAIRTEPLPQVDEDSHEAGMMNYELWAEIAETTKDDEKRREAWTSAADEAMAAGKGKLAAKYFAQSEI
jgi:hypothetical protein